MIKYIYYLGEEDGLKIVLHSKYGWTAHVKWLKNKNGTRRLNENWK